MELELKRLIKHGYLEGAADITEDCFVSPIVITLKKDKSIKIALDSRKLSEVTKKRKAQKANMEELISRISRKISEGKEGEILKFWQQNWTSITHMDRSNWTKIQKISVYSLCKEETLLDTTVS